MERGSISRCASKFCRAGVEGFRLYSRFSKLVEWCGYRIYFSKAVIIVSGLVYSYRFVELVVLFTLISHLTDYWKKEHFAEAVAIVNVQEGVSATMLIVFAHISDAYTGRLIVLKFSIAASIFGLVLLWQSAWFLTIHYEVKLFFVAVVLIALGQAGKDALLKDFLADQLCEKEQNPLIDEKRVVARTNFWWGCVGFLVFIASVAFSNTNTSFIYTFKVSAMVMGVAYLLFWSGITLYYRKNPTGSPLTSVLGVLKAAIWKRHLNYPDSATQFLENDSDERQLSPHNPFFKWLDKAAIVESSTLSPEEQEKKGTLYPVTRVKEVKSVTLMFPLWTTFLVYTLVDAAGSTFFVEQSNNLNAQIGKHFKVPMMIFFVLKSYTGSQISVWVKRLIKKRYSTKAERRHATLVRIGFGLLCCLLCCIAAYVVEDRRLNLIKKKGLQSDPDTSIGMSIIWLVPQFILLGLMRGLAQKGLDAFFDNQVAKSMASYGPHINEFMLGIGKFLTVFGVYVVRSWFGNTMNTSHLDRYYGILAFLSLGNLFFYLLVVTTFYAHNDAPEEDVDLQEVLVTNDTVPVSQLHPINSKSYAQPMTSTPRMRSLSRVSSEVVRKEVNTRSRTLVENCSETEFKVVS
ncbi:hypothetical protein L1049_007678 [Liquidambar formosana]|uniref:Uncharacterized protein n=1 Tax=Liquidambar formosana TaxID=63359 RepID=A0AAP0X7P8_LIQFO